MPENPAQRASATGGYAAAICREHPAVIERGAAHNRSAILDAGNPLQDIQHAPRTIRHVLIAYQDAAERRDLLAAEVGEHVRELIASLVAAGSSEHDVRASNIPNPIWARG